MPLPPSDPERLERFPLRPPPRISGGLLALVGLSFFFVISAVSDELVPAEDWPLLVVLALAISLLPLAAAYFLRRPQPGATIELLPDRIHLPISSGQGAVPIRYRDITALYLREARSGFLLVGTSLGNFVFPVRAFLDSADPRRLEQTIRERILALPDGEARILAFDQKGAQAGATFAYPIRATVAVLGLLVVAYLLEQFGRAFEHPFGLVAFGASARVLVLQGQWYRLFTGSLLHANLIHIFLNGLAIQALGSAIERLYGSRNFLLIFLVSAVVGTGLSVLSNRAALSVGASTAAFGLFGAYAFTAYRYRDRMPTGFRPALRWWLWVIGINLMISVLVPQIDFPAHLGGFMGGVVVGAFLLEGDPNLPLRGPRPWWSRILLWAVVSAHLVAIVFAAMGYYAHGPEDIDQVMIGQLDRGVGDKTSFNAIAWMIAIDPKATQEQLEKAKKAALLAFDLTKAERKAIQGQGGGPLDQLLGGSKEAEAFLDAYEGMVADTVATTEYRLGELDAAVRRELPLLAKRGDPVIAAQAARFLAARAARLGPLVEAEARPLGTSSVAVTLSYESNRGFAVNVRAAAGIPQPVGAFGLVRSQGKLVGLLELRLDAETPLDRPNWLEQRNIFAAWPNDSVLELVWLGKPRAWHGWSLDAATLAYP